MTIQNPPQSLGHFTAEALLMMLPKHVQFPVLMGHQNYVQRMKLVSQTHRAKIKNHFFVESLGKMPPNPALCLVKLMMTVT